MANGNAAKAAVKPKSYGTFARFGRFLRESYIETWKKSSWPSWSELRQFTIIVILAVSAATIWIAICDGFLIRITQYIGR